MKNVHFENKSISRHFFWFIWFIYVVVYMTKNCFSAAMAAGVMNAATSLGVVVNSYGITKIAEVYDWTVVKIVFLGLIAVALLLMLVMIPFWKRFKKKYHPHVSQPLVEN